MARSFAAPRAVYDLTWEELTEGLQAYYAPTPSQIARRFAYRRRVQKPSESVNQFLQALRVAAAQCDFPDLEDNLAEQFVCGLKDIFLRRRLLGKPKVTLVYAIDEARAAELADLSSVEIDRYLPHAAAFSIVPALPALPALPGPDPAPPQPSTYITNLIDELPPLPENFYTDQVDRLRATPHRPQQQQPALIRTPAASPACIGCGGSHTRSTCPFETAVCHRCGKKGHLTQVCRAALPPLSPAEQPPVYGRPPPPKNQPARRQQPRREDCYTPAVSINLASVGLSLTGVHSVVDTPSDVAAVLKDYADIFNGQLGQYKGTPISLNLDPQVAPIRLKAHRVPFALMLKVDAELDKLLAQGVLEPVDHSRWETPVVIPGCIFSKLDKAQAYQQLPVDDDAVAAQTIITHQGAFRCRCLQFGRNYSQIDKKALAAVSGVKKFHDYLYGRHVTLYTDHKPLLGLLAGDRPTPPILSPRMTRWTEFLAAYSYALCYCLGKHLGHADALSRCPLPCEDPQPVPCLSVLSITELDLPLTSTDVASNSRADPVLSQVMAWVVRDWPTEPIHPDCWALRSRQLELSLHSGCLLWGDHVVIPSVLRNQVLQRLHADHPGVAGMKALARSYVWWPGLDSEIEAWVARCVPCQESCPSPPSSPSREWEMPRGPWSRIHIDFAGPFHGQVFLVAVDAYSRWVELILMLSTTAKSTVWALRWLFATHGLPDTVVSDNGPQFTSTAFQTFLAAQGIRHAPVAPYHPASNGRAERAVRSAKEALGRMNQGDWQEHQDHNSFLLCVPVSNLLATFYGSLEQCSVKTLRKSTTREALRQKLSDRSLSSPQTRDMPATRGYKFGYADDLAIAVQEKHMEGAVSLFSQNLKILGKFFTVWRLTPSDSKMVTMCFQQTSITPIHSTLE
ncbi:PREDICTED: uncharacterized protein K02A2.6-like [Thamnophis sirtalis]|uniref:Gypsy retrotransposon integrase-like protein 1 n=1 Tax=Thamnophis sirtalis TaxID=35019 RepID=A0A6I9YC53_9SAUR|nr:PREDICTED: uncharacterized protein K02A2.6-like [Thamnophis sirtalis]